LKQEVDSYKPVAATQFLLINGSAVVFLSAKIRVISGKK